MTRSFLIFVGPGRSGTTVLSHLVDAHLDATVGFEVNVLRMASSGAGRKEIEDAVVRNSVGLGNHPGRRHKIPYDLMPVPGQSNGNGGNILLGDKKAGASAIMIGRRPRILDEFTALMMPRRLKILMCLRDPADVMRSLIRRKGVTEEEAFRTFLRHMPGVREVKRRALAGDVPLLSVFYEDLIQWPRQTLTGVMRWLDLPFVDGFLDACLSVLRPPSSGTDLTQGMMRLVQEACRNDDLFRRYLK